MPTSHLTAILSHSHYTTHYSIAICISYKMLHGFCEQYDIMRTLCNEHVGKRAMRQKLMIGASMRAAKKKKKNTTEGMRRGFFFT